MFPMPLPISSISPEANFLILSYSHWLIADVPEKISRVSKPTGSECAPVIICGTNYISEYNRLHAYHPSIQFFSHPDKFVHSKKYPLHKYGYRVCGLFLR